MKIQDFINDLTEELELENSLELETDLTQLDEWDSMAVMVIIAYVSDNLDITLTGEDLQNITTTQSLINKIGSDKFN